MSQTVEEFRESKKQFIEDYIEGYKKGYKGQDRIDNPSTEFNIGYNDGQKDVSKILF